MANYAYIWELGGGMGHLQRMRAISQQAIAAGHRVNWFVPSQSLAAASVYWPDVAAAPTAPPPRIRVREPGSLAEILQNEGWTDPKRLKARIGRWQEVLDGCRPDHVLLDFAPNALAATVAERRQVTVLGTGFYIPPKLSPLPSFRQDHGVYTDRLLWVEQQVTAAATEAIGQPLDGLCDLLHHANVDNRLLTYGEWDHYPGRAGASRSCRYCGIATGFQGKEATWPESGQRRVFAYLKPFPHLPSLLRAFQELDLSVLVHGSPEIAGMVRNCNSGSIRFFENAADERSIAAAGAVLINHAGHDGSIKAAMAGLAMWQIPLNIEQLLTAENAQRLGIAEWTHAFAFTEFRTALGGLLDRQQARQRAARTWSASAQTTESAFEFS